MRRWTAAGDVGVPCHRRKSEADRGGFVGRSGGGGEFVGGGCLLRLRFTTVREVFESRGVDHFQSKGYPSLFRRDLRSPPNLINDVV